ncbi:MAG TPA: hypothetical protein VH913_13850 [Hyphomicrobiaceae bacterium]|jgi:hypothetical protein
MSIGTHGLDRDVADDVARRRAPRCYTRPAIADTAQSRLNVENIALAFALVAVSCAAFLILSQGWSL